MNTEQEKMNLDFRSRFDYVKSLSSVFRMNDEECNTFLWILDMWDKKLELPPPTDFKLQNTKP